MYLTIYLHQRFPKYKLKTSYSPEMKKAGSKSRQNEFFKLSKSMCCMRVFSFSLECTGSRLAVRLSAPQWRHSLSRLAVWSSGSYLVDLLHCYRINARNSCSTK